eukprot:141341-Lingulodinium_polyedra.AAC.1
MHLARGLALSVKQVLPRGKIPSARIEADGDGALGARHELAEQSVVRLPVSAIGGPAGGLSLRKNGTTIVAKATLQ